MTVANCSKCRRIFQRTTSPLCPACFQESVSQISNAYRFIQENPHLTLDEIADHCQIPFKELEKMLFEGKLGTATSNIMYSCQRCGQKVNAMMRRGRFCMPCAGKIETEAGLGHEKADKPEKKVRLVSSHPDDQDEPATLDPIVRHPEDDYDAEFIRRQQETQEPAGPDADSYGFKRISER